MIELDDRGLTGDERLEAKLESAKAAASKAKLSKVLDKAENPGPPFIYCYESFAVLIREWGSKESGEEGLENLKELHRREYKGAERRRGKAPDTMICGASVTLVRG